jgi:2-phospho-L-lactate/phosphoenolpyruvate guanylyltransferase
MRAMAIIPVKRFGAAKQRLQGALGAARTAIVRAMLTDVLGAVSEAKLVERVIVVTAERRAERIALQTAQRVTTPVEVLREPDDRGHSEAATLGIFRAKALGAECVALLPGDCPLLDPRELDAALGRMFPGRVAVIPDRHGTGTNGLLLAPPDALGPAFGEGSRDRHLDRASRAGLDVAVEELASLGLDLDTPEDLEALVSALGSEARAGAVTAAELARVGIPIQARR